MNTKIQKEIVITLILSMSRALLGAVTPSLRGVAFTCDAANNKVQILFFHEGFVSEVSEELYEEIASEASCDFFVQDQKIEYDLRIVSSNECSSFPQGKEFFWIYRRREPFKDPKD